MLTNKGLKMPELEELEIELETHLRALRKLKSIELDLQQKTYLANRSLNHLQANIHADDSVQPFDETFLHSDNLKYDEKGDLKTAKRSSLGKMIGQSEAIQKVYDLILKAAVSDTNVVIYGESGTGKELAARAIHDLSGRRNKEFVAVNCGAIPETLLESEFFGYKKGAFTGAFQDKHGYLDLADGGTLFLDEVAELSTNMQVKLLRALDDGGYIPVGRSKPLQSDFRIIAATNRNLAERLKQGAMREDFFFRIHIIPVTIPPLRERRDDIPLLIKYFLRKENSNHIDLELPDTIQKMIYHYHWPGNVRELQNVIHRYLAVKTLDLMAAQGKAPTASVDGTAVESRVVKLQKALEDFEKEHIIKILQDHHWHRGKAARQLGITRNTLFRKMRKFGLE